MGDPSRARVDDIFLDAIEMPPSARSGFLDEACGGDERLRRKVEALLEADAAAGGADFLESAFLANESDSTPQPNTSDGSRPEDASPDTSRFRIMSQHQQGGLGEVLIAYDQQLKRTVAIKQIKPKWLGHDEARQRFVQEAEVTGQLEHPGVVPVYAMGTWDDGRQYYAMRFIQGETLGEVIDHYHSPQRKLDSHGRQLELRQILNRFMDVCNTIEYAHSHQILHRDIKPANVMVGRYGETLVVDWGLAKLLNVTFDESMTAGLMKDQASGSGSTPTQAGGRVGTPQYMSPEQASGELEEVGTWTDIYLLGATLFQILTGRPPHSDESISKLMDRIIRGDLTRPRVFDAEISPALEAICLKAMAKEPCDRYSSASELAGDIECWMADEPVSVFRDPPTVKVGRWVRRHRTAAYTSAVALLLLTIGSIVGSMLWSYQRTRQFEVERQNEAKEAQLLATRQQRLNELRASADAGIQLAQTELSVDRFSSALRILEGVVDAISDDDEIASEYAHVLARIERLRRIVEFYRYADITHEQNLLSRDTKAIMSCSAGLRSLGILDKNDWWSQLPDEDLTAQQKDELRWDVYRQLLALDALLIKTIGTRLSGSNRPGTVSSFLPALRRLVNTNVGKREAAAALIISDRADMFRHSESVRWFRSVAQFRLGDGRRLLGRDLDTTRNAPDAHNLGVLSLISALDESFRIVFRDYKGDDSLAAARDLFSRSSKLRPDYYWAQLALAQSEYLLAARDNNPSWRKYDAAIHAASRCIAMEPEKCFAYADRSSMYRAMGRLIADDPNLSDVDRTQLASETRQWSLNDAELADRLGADQPWIGWQHGLALMESDQEPAAIDRFLRASKLTFPFIDVEDASLVRVDDVRGRSEAVDLMLELTERVPENARYHSVLASIKLNQNRLPEALESAERALSSTDPPAHAYAVRGMIRLQSEQYELAADDFQQAASLDANHDWAAFGLAVCREALEQFDEALAEYRRGESIAQTDEHRAGCLLGQSRLLGRSQLFDQSRAAIEGARHAEPACDLMIVIRPLARVYGQLKAKDPEGPQTIAMKEFLQSLGQMPRATKIDWISGETFHEPFQAALLNGGFELGTMKYWQDESGVSWSNERGYRSTAIISRDVAHQGSYSLHIRGGKAESNDMQARTGQIIPFRVAASGRVSAWVKADGLNEGGLRITDASGNVVISVPAGSYDWRRLEGDLGPMEQAGDSGGVGSIRLEIVSAGPGEAWIDDLEVRCEPMP